MRVRTGRRGHRGGRELLRRLSDGHQLSTATYPLIGGQSDIIGGRVASSGHSSRRRTRDQRQWSGAALRPARQACRRGRWRGRARRSEAAKHFVAVEFGSRTAALSPNPYAPDMTPRSLTRRPILRARHVPVTTHWGFARRSYPLQMHRCSTRGATRSATSESPSLDSSPGAGGGSADACVDRRPVALVGKLWLCDSRGSLRILSDRLPGGSQ